MTKTPESTFYIDCEFDGHNGPLISFAIVRGDGDGMHICVTEAPEPADPWVAENIIPVLLCYDAPKGAHIPLNSIGPVLRAFIGDCAEPTIIADSPVDIGRFCQAISTGVDGKWSSTGYPMMRFEVHNVDCWPNDLPGAVQHNAWWDAMALRATIQGGSHD